MIRSLVMLTVVSVVLAGCGKSAQQKADEGNQKIDRLNEINRSVAAEYNVAIMYNDAMVSSAQVDTINVQSIRSLSNESLVSLTSSVQEFSSTSAEIIALVESGDVKTYGDVESLRLAHTNAGNILNSIKYEQQTRASMTAQANQELSRLLDINRTIAAEGLQLMYNAAKKSATEVDMANTQALTSLSVQQLTDLLPLVQEYTAKSMDVLSFAARRGVTVTGDLTEIRLSHEASQNLESAIRSEQLKRASTQASARDAS